MADEKLADKIPLKKNSENVSNPKKITKRKRKNLPFPTATYEESLAIAKAIWKFASGQKIRRITLFDGLKRSPDSGMSRALVTNSAKYKLTTGSYSAEFLELTNEGAIATNPDGNAIEKLESSFKLAIQNNEYFNKLYEQYKEMRLPTTTVLEDFLVENGLPREDCARCVEVFIVNCRFLGFIQVLSGSERLVSLDYLKENISKKIVASPSNDIILETNDIRTIELSQNHSESQSQNQWEHICFFIAPIGEDTSIERQHSDLFLEQIVEPVLSQFNLRVIRADKINTAGTITSQIIEHIIKSKLVIADLSFHNPNVFYELSLRHAQNKPAIHLIRKSDKIPFDVNTFRTIEIDDSSIYTLLPQLESYKVLLSQQVRNILDDPTDVENPITAYFQSTKLK